MTTVINTVTNDRDEAIKNTTPVRRELCTFEQTTTQQQVSE